ncbi:MAG TPA: ComEC/Rec2 family competence protein [Acetobacteraceae bacterium]|nr:ComEC/Rec2 family competence protein [Acetobacteraceae bacterium]
MPVSARAALDESSPALRDAWSALLRLAAGERERLILFLPVAMGAGILIYFDLLNEPSPILAYGLPLAAGAALAICWRHPVPRGAALLILAASLGFARAAQHSAAYPPFPPIPRHAVVISGRIAGIDLLPAGRRIVIAHPALGDAPPMSRDVRVRLHRGDDAALAAGDVIQVRALLFAQDRPAYPGGWSFARDAYFAGLAASGFALGPVKVTRAAPPGWGMRLRGLRDAVAARILAVLPVSTGSIAATLMTGFEQSIPPAERQDFITAGLAHLLAVAGLHVGIVMGVAYAIARFLAGFSEFLLLRVPAKMIASVASFLAGLGYAALTGFHVPIIRSLAMAALVLAGLMAGRRALSLRGLGLAAVALMLIEPDAVPGPSFQMSFSAVLALIAGYEVVGRRLLSHADGLGQRFFRHVGALGFTSLLAGGASMPFAAYHFQQIEPYYVLANLVAVPLTAIFVMPLGLASVALMPLHLERLALIPMGWGIQAILWTARLIGHLPHALIEIEPMPGSAAALMGVGLAILGILRSRLRFAGLIPILAGLMLTLSARPPVLVVSPDARLIAVRDGAAVRILRMPRASKFTLEQWRSLWPDRPQRVETAREACPDGRCAFDRGAILFLAGRRAAAAGCGDARVVVSPQPLRGACRAPGVLVIDRFTVWRDGAVSVPLVDGAPRLLSDRMMQGRRPWVPPWPRWHRWKHRS